MQLLDTAQSARAIRDGAFTDLSPLLAGDAIDEWPNLANIREDQWRYVAYDGKIVGFPIDLPAYNNEFRYRQDWAENGYPDPPADAEEFKELFASFSKMGVDGRYGLADAPGTAMIAANAMFHVPIGWRYENGSLTYHQETEEFAAAVQFMTELWEEGAFHPDALSLDANVGQTLSMIPAGTVGISWIATANWFNPGVYYDALQEAPDSWAPFGPAPPRGRRCGPVRPFHRGLRPSGDLLAGRRGRGEAEDAAGLLQLPARPLRQRGALLPASTAPRATTSRAAAEGSRRRWRAPASSPRPRSSPTAWPRWSTTSPVRRTRSPSTSST